MKKGSNGRCVNGLNLLCAMISMFDQGRSRVTLEEAVTKAGVSLSYGEQIVSSLSPLNVFKGIRGPGGGYDLNRAIENVTLAEVLRVLSNDRSIDGKTLIELYRGTTLREYISARECVARRAA